MSKTVIPFPGRKPTAEELLRRVRELAASDAIDFAHPHFQQRMRERDVSQRQVLNVLTHGEVLSGPTLDQYGDWRIRLVKITAGRRVRVVVAVRDDLVTVVTVTK